MPKISASQWRDNDGRFAPEKLLDGSTATYWATDDVITTAYVDLEFPTPITFNLIRLREFIALGQRVDEFLIEIDQAGSCRNIIVVKPSAIDGWRMVQRALPTKYA